MWLSPTNPCSGPNYRKPKKPKPLCLWQFCCLFPWYWGGLQGVYLCLIPGPASIRKSIPQLRRDLGKLAEAYSEFCGLLGKDYMMILERLILTVTNTSNNFSLFTSRKKALTLGRRSGKKSGRRWRVDYSVQWLLRRDSSAVRALVCITIGPGFDPQSLRLNFFLFYIPVSLPSFNGWKDNGHLMYLSPSESFQRWLICFKSAHHIKTYGIGRSWL